MKTRFIAIVSAICLSACTTLSEPMDPDFGAAVTAANDMQIVSKTAAPGAPKPDASVQSSAVERYRTDNVKKPKQAVTAAD